MTHPVAGWLVASGSALLVTLAALLVVAAPTVAETLSDQAFRTATPAQGERVPVEGTATGYRLHLAVTVTGEAVPLPTGSPEPADRPNQHVSAPPVEVTSQPTPQPGPPDVVADVLPFAIVALAVGGAAGFELSRRGW